MLEYPPGPRDQQLVQLVPPTLPLQVGYVLLLVNMKNSETMGHKLEYPPRPRDQQLIQLVPPTLPLQVGYVLLQGNMKKKKANKNSGNSEKNTKTLY